MRWPTESCLPQRTQQAEKCAHSKKLLVTNKPAERPKEGKKIQRNRKDIDEKASPGDRASVTDQTWTNNEAVSRRRNGWENEEVGELGRGGLVEEGILSLRSQPNSPYP